MNKTKNKSNCLSKYRNFFVRLHHFRKIDDYRTLLKIIILECMRGQH